MVGNFYLQFINCRIALLFDQELIRTPSLLSIIERYRVDVVSVVVNTQKDINRDSQVVLTPNKQKEVLGKLKLFTKSRNIALVYGGSQFVPSMSTIYWEKAFVMQG